MVRGIYRIKGGAVSLLQTKRSESYKIQLVVRKLSPDRRRAYLHVKLQELAVLERYGLGDREAMKTVMDEMIRT